MQVFTAIALVGLRADANGRWLNLVLSESLRQTAGIEWLASQVSPGCVFDGVQAGEYDAGGKVVALAEDFPKVGE